MYITCVKTKSDTLLISAVCNIWTRLVSVWLNWMWPTWKTKFWYYSLERTDINHIYRSINSVICWTMITHKKFTILASLQTYYMWVRIIRKLWLSKEQFTTWNSVYAYCFTQRSCSLLTATSGCVLMLLMLDHAGRKIWFWQSMRGN